MNFSTADKCLTNVDLNVLMRATFYEMFWNNKLDAQQLRDMTKILKDNYCQLPRGGVLCAGLR